MMISKIGILTVCGLALAMAPIAMGQGALDRNLDRGGSKPLDRKLNRAPQNEQPRGGRDFASEVKFRNAIVTGNAPGGVSFRGFVGYSDSRDFTGRSASDDIFAYRRDSYFSGLSGAGIRGTEALQYQFSMSTGSQGARGLTGSLEMSSTNAARTTFGRDTTTTEREARNDWLRSSSTYTASRGLRPTDLGNRKLSETEAEQTTVSPLLGVKTKKFRPNPLAVDGSITRPPAGTPAATPNPAAPNTTPTANPPGTPATTPGVTPTPTPVPAPTRENTTKIETLEDRIGDRLSKWDKDEVRKPGEPARWERRVDGVRRHLLIVPRNDPDAPAEESGKTLDGESLRMLRESATKIDSYVAPPPGVRLTDVYAKSMIAGQKSMASGDFFDAEAKFGRAITAVPGDTGAMAGRLHAQLGAGMLLSASVNLRNMLTVSPAVASATFDPKLLPPVGPLKDLAATLRERLKQNPEADAIARTMSDSEIGLMLAYIGWITNDLGTVKEGLAAVAPTKVTTELDEQNARLANFLRAVWLGEIPASAPTAPTPDQPKPEGAKPEVAK